MTLFKFRRTTNGRSADGDTCIVCGSSITIEMDGFWSSYRVCLRNGHRQDDPQGPVPLAGTAFYPARG